MSADAYFRAPWFDEGPADQMVVAFHDPNRGTIWHFTFEAQVYDDSEGDEILAKELRVVKTDNYADATEAWLIVRHNKRELWTHSGLNAARHFLSGDVTQGDLFSGQS